MGHDTTAPFSIVLPVKMKIPLRLFLSRSRHAYRKSPLKTAGFIAVSLAMGVTSSQAQSSYTFTNGAGDNSYNNAANWNFGVVPDTSNGDTAIINNGSAVTYTPGGDLTIKNGGMLQVSSGSFTQVVGPAYLQLNGNGTVLVNGGTFNQGTSSSSPFNVTNTGNVFNVTAGAANIRTNFQINTGLAFTQSGGTITVAGNETDFNGGSSLLSGGTFITNLITGVNGPAGNTFNISGGVLNLTGATAIYGGGATHYLNFTPGSTGQIVFSNAAVTASQVQGFLANSVIEYNNTPNSNQSLFNIASNNGIITLSLASAVPEPSTYALVGILGSGLVAFRRRRR